MNEQVFQRVLQTLAERRDANEREEQHRLREVLDKCPEIGTLMEERRNAVLGSVYGAFSAPVANDLPERVEAWNTQIRSLLTGNGFPEDYLEPVFQCPLCEDTGFIGSSRKAVCSCAKAMYAQLVESEGGFDEDQTFESFDLNVFPEEAVSENGVTQRQLMQVIRRRCEEYADALPYPAQKTLLLYGGSGLGKTYLLRCIHERARRHGVPALCVTANQLIRTARKAVFSRDQSELDALYETDLLLIDDLGTEPLIENVTVEELFNLINERQNDGMCTVLSTNLNLSELKRRYTERVVSRLLDRQHCQALHFLGRDIR